MLKKKQYQKHNRSIGQEIEEEKKSSWQLFHFLFRAQGETKAIPLHPNSHQPEIYLNESFQVNQIWSNDLKRNCWTSVWTLHESWLILNVITIKFSWTCPVNWERERDNVKPKIKRLQRYDIWALNSDRSMNHSELPWTFPSSLSP